MVCPPESGGLGRSSIVFHDEGLEHWHHGKLLNCDLKILVRVTVGGVRVTVGGVRVTPLADPLAYKARPITMGPLRRGIMDITLNMYEHSTLPASHSCLG